MGSGGAKETNRLLGEQQRAAQGITNTANQRSAEQYNQVSGLPTEILNNYRNLYSSIGAEGGGGGGGGPGYTAAQFESSTLPFYLKLMNEGGYSEADKANMLSYATGPISGLFEGLKRSIESRQAGRGIPGYSSGSSRLARDQAYQTSEAAKGFAGDLAKMVLQSKLQGASGATGVESEKRAFEASERARALANARANASAGRASSQQDFRNQMAILEAMGGYRPGSDLSYMGAALSGVGAGTQAAGSRVSETPAWQKALSGIVPSAAGAAVGAFSGGGYGGGRPNIPTSSNYYDPYLER